jgi:hypothetical protein
MVFDFLNAESSIHSCTVPYRRDSQIGHLMESTSGRANVVCPQCDKRGTVIWETSPKFARPAIASISQGFLLVDSRGNVRPRLMCATCRADVVDVLHVGAGHRELAPNVK